MKNQKHDLAAVPPSFDPETISKWLQMGPNKKILQIAADQLLDCPAFKECIRCDLLTAAKAEVEYLMIKAPYTVAKTVVMQLAVLAFELESISMLPYPDLISNSEVGQRLAALTVEIFVGLSRTRAMELKAYRMVAAAGIQLDRQSIRDAQFNAVASVMTQFIQQYAEQMGQKKTALILAAMERQVLETSVVVKEREGDGVLARCL